MKKKKHCLLVATIVFSFPLSGMASSRPLAGPLELPDDSIKGAPALKRPGIDRSGIDPKAPILKLPDLIVTDFTVNQNDMTTEGPMAKFPFRVMIRNTGKAPVSSTFYVGIQRFSESRQIWDRGDAPNCIQIAPQLQPNTVRLLTGEFKILSSQLSNQTVKIRAFADDGCYTEMPPQYGLIPESRENNNHSNDSTIAGGYMPNLAGIHPTLCLKVFDTAHISGAGFGSQQGNHTVVVENDNHKTAVDIQSWHGGAVYFKVPTAAKTGNSSVYIADSGTLQRRSNMLTFKVGERRSLQWSDLLLAWDLFKSAFSMRLHTWTGGSTPSNQSTIKILQEFPVDIPNLQFKTDLGHYRFLVNDINSRSDSIVLSKNGCKKNQLRLSVSFEGQGRELIGYYRDLLKLGNWSRNGAPDIQVNDAKLDVTFSFVSNAGVLSYVARTNFTASVNATGNVWPGFLNAFSNGWQNTVRSSVESGAYQALMNSQTKNSIVTDFVRLIRLLTPVGSKRTITDVQFTPTTIDVTFY